MLKSLREFEPIIAQGLLARATLAVLAKTPNDAPEPQIENEESVRQSILSELDEILRLSSERNQDRARSKLLARLGDEINEIAARRLDFDAAEIRLGARGLLKPSQYKIRFSETFETMMFEVRFGVHRSHVERAVHSPDDVQHMIPTEFGMIGDEIRLSVFLKSFKSRRGGKEALLVVAQRTGRDLLIDQAWRVPGFIFARQDRLNSYAVLRDFVDEVGIEMPMFRSKFVYNTSVVVDSPSDLPRTWGEFVTLFFGNIERQSVVTSLWFKGQKNPPRIEISMAYAIDAELYLAVLNHL